MSYLGTEDTPPPSYRTNKVTEDIGFREQRLKVIGKVFI